MAFLRKKKISGKVYYYLVQNSRIDGKVKQKVIAYLGNSGSLLKKLNLKGSTNE